MPWLELRINAAQPLACPLFLQAFSHLYANTDSMVSTFLRIDIPKLEELDQYNYVLFTGGHTAG